MTVTPCVALVLAATVAACGGGGGGSSSDTGPPPTSGASAGTVYAHSQILGLATAQSLTYQPGTPPASALVESVVAGSFLNAGATMLVAEYVPPLRAGVRVACVSGNGSSIGVLDAVNPGVVSLSAALLLDAGWVEQEPEAAFAAASAASERWDGWENCGIKPEGLPYKSSTVTPSADGGYSEDLYIGNPLGNFTTVRDAVSPTDAAQMRQAGHATTEDPRRSLQITWRVFKDTAGQTVWIERGEPSTSASPGTRGFLTLFVPQR